MSYTKCTHPNPKAHKDRYHFPNEYHIPPAHFIFQRTSSYFRGISRERHDAGVITFLMSTNPFQTDRKQHSLLIFDVNTILISKYAEIHTN